MPKIANTYAIARRGVFAVAIFCMILGVVLSHYMQRGVRVEKVIIAGNVPALQFLPTGAGAHPVVLLAHGTSASRYSLFSYGEALAAAGFVCYAPDFPGHGMSPELYSFNGMVQTFKRIAESNGPVDIIIGHSLGGLTGGEAVYKGYVTPRLFIAIGSLPQLGDHAPPLVLLNGRWDEYFTPEIVKSRTNATVVLSPWSDHVLETYDPVLVTAAVKAACEAVGKTAPASSRCWIWRPAGSILATLAVALLTVSLPRLPTGSRGVIIAVLFLAATSLTVGVWNEIGCFYLQRLPKTLVATAITLMVLMGAAKVRIPRWSFFALAVVLAVISVLAGSVFYMMLALPLALILGLGTVFGGLASYCGSRCDGDIAMAIVVGFSLFQWHQPPRIAAFPQTGHPIPMAVARLDHYAGRYAFPPSNVFPCGMIFNIWRRGDRLVGRTVGIGARLGVCQIWPESETNFFLTVRGKQHGEQLIFIRDDKGEVIAVIDREIGYPDCQGSKL